jgi:acyl carrier protein
VAIAAIPLTPNGKLALDALPPPDRGASGYEHVPPRNDAEQMMARIWEDVLGREAVGVHDDFFALGGHSLIATRITARVRDRFGVELPLRRLFEHPTIAGLTAIVAAAPRAAGAAAIAAEGASDEERLLSSLERLSERELDALISRFSS